MFSYVSRLYLHTETCLIPFIFSSLMVCDGVSLYRLHFTAQHPHFNYPLLHPSLLRFWVEGRRRVGEEERRRRGNKEEIEGRIEKEGKNCKKGGVGWLWVEWMGGLFWARRGEESEGRMQSRALTVFVHKWADNGSFNTWHKCWFWKKNTHFPTSISGQSLAMCDTWQEGAGVSLPGWCWCLYTDTDNPLFSIFPNGVQPLPPGSVVPCRSCHHSLVWWRVEPLQRNYTFISPNSPPASHASEAPLPLMLPIPSQLCSLPFHISATPALAHRLHPYLMWAQIPPLHPSRPQSPSLPFLTPISHCLPHQRQVQRNEHKGMEMEAELEPEYREVEAKEIRGKRGEKQHEIVWNVRVGQS